MAFLRAIAWLLLLIAVISLTSDLTRGNGSASALLTTTLSHWKDVSPGSLAATAAFVRDTISPKAWDPVLVRVLLLPAWALFGALGVALALLGRRKRRVNIYAN